MLTSQLFLRSKVEEERLAQLMQALRLIPRLIRNKRRSQLAYGFHFRFNITGLELNISHRLV